MNHQFAAPERFRDELRDALLEHAATLPHRDPSPRAHPMRRRLLPVLALVAIASAAVLLLRSGGAIAPQRATAAGVLRASATAVERLGGSRAIGPGEYFYTRTLEWWRYAGFSPHPYVVRSVQEAWTARDGHGHSHYDVIGLSGEGVNRSLPLTRSSDARRAPSPRPFILAPVPTPGILASYAELRSLPANPAGLSAAIDALTARHHVDRVFPQRDIRTAIRFEVLTALAEAPTSAAVRSALYRLLAATPGIRLLGPARDAIGRAGMAVADRVGDVEFEVIIDPASGQVLQASRTLLHRSKLFLEGEQPAGLIDRATFLATRVVASTR